MPPSCLRRATERDVPEIHRILNDQSIKDFFVGADGTKAFKSFEIYLTNDNSGAVFVHRLTPEHVSFHVCLLGETVEVMRDLKENLNYKSAQCNIHKDNRKARSLAVAMGMKKLCEYGDNIIYSLVKKHG